MLKKVITMSGGLPFVKNYCKDVSIISVIAQEYTQASRLEQGEERDARIY